MPAKPNPVSTDPPTNMPLPKLALPFIPAPPLPPAKFYIFNYLNMFLNA